MADCCREHLSKLAAIVLNYAEAYPYHSCYRRAISVDGLETLGHTVPEIVELAGYPKEWADAAAGIPHEEIVRILRDQFDGVEFDSISSIASYTREERDLDNPE